VSGRRYGAGGLFLGVTRLLLLVTKNIPHSHSTGPLRSLGIPSHLLDRSPTLPGNTLALTRQVPRAPWESLRAPWESLRTYSTGPPRSLGIPSHSLGVPSRSLGVPSHLLDSTPALPGSPFALTRQYPNAPWEYPRSYSTVPPRSLGVPSRFLGTPSHLLDRSPALPGNTPAVTRQYPNAPWEYPRSYSTVPPRFLGIHPQLLDRSPALPENTLAVTRQVPDATLESLRSHSNLRRTTKIVPNGSGQPVSHGFVDKRSVTRGYTEEARRTTEACFRE
jgi:hypothetical protein